MSNGISAFSLHFDADGNLRVEPPKGTSLLVENATQEEYLEKYPVKGILKELRQVGIAHVDGSGYCTVYFLGRYWVFPC